MLSLWLKTFHLLFMICWFSGLFYLPRLFVYHALSQMAPADPLGQERFCLMERKLFWGIMTPSALLTLIFGLGTWHLGHYEHPHWLHAKLGLIGLLGLFHIQCGRYLKRFAQRQSVPSPTFFRWFNEIPVLLLMGILGLAVFRPLFTG